MYQIMMKKNEDFGEKQCFLSRESFKPGKVIVTLEKKHNSKFRPVGFINPSKIKDCWACTENLDSEDFNENCKTGLFLETCTAPICDQISATEKRISFLESIIGTLNDEMREYKEHCADLESVISGIKNTNFRFPTWKEYLAVLKDGGAK